MIQIESHWSRRRFMGVLAAGATALTARVLAEELMKTPRRPKGPSTRTDCRSTPTMTC